MKFKDLFLRMAVIFSIPLLLTSAFTLTAWADSIKANEQPNYAIEPVKDILDLKCKSAILIEAETGRVIYEQNADEALPPASVTKVMTLLLVMEAIDSGKIKLDDMVTVSERAASMGGSQIYLEVGEQMCVEDMLKSVIIASANDAACALAEYVAGSESAFVKAMNDRAAQLGMKNTCFENTNGLDDTARNHKTSARDIAIMSAELIKHKKILEYSSIWMDTVRGGLFGLTNTNRLVRYYSGCTGLKTGYTSQAGYCVSASAERNGVSLICVVMGAESSEIRNSTATSLLDWGFANYGVYRHEAKALEPLKVLGGVADSVEIGYEDFSFVTEKSSIGKIQYKIVLPESISAPIASGDKVGEVVFTLDGKEIGRIPITALATVNRIGFGELWLRMLGRFLLK